MISSYFFVVILFWLICNREKKYKIEDENLERKYKDWQKKLHPDLVHSKSEVCLNHCWILRKQIVHFYIYSDSCCVNVFFLMLERERVCCWTIWSSDWSIPHAYQPIIEGNIHCKILWRCILNSKILHMGLGSIYTH